ncbi:MAG: hypothetical protein RRB22_01820 [Gammaproteobacteria bacterium]|nr:hypothetical protein [Gammaproteobacteria bacterium]
MEIEKATMSAWQVDPKDFPRNGSQHDKSEFMLRYALLASSFYNTQPWQFEVNDKGDQINIYADNSRWLKMADPDKRELYISLGCALENLLITIAYFGMGHRSVSYFPEGYSNDWAVRIILGAANESIAPRPEYLFSAISHRDTFIKKYFKNEPISSADLQSITGFLGEHIYVDTDMQHQVELDTINDPKYKDEFVRLVRDSDAILFSDSEFRHELTSLNSGGHYYNPWLSEELELLDRDMEAVDMIATKESKIIANAAVFGVLTSNLDEPTSAVKVGQVFERMALEASLHDVSIYPVFQLLEIPEMRTDLEKMLPDLKTIPQLVFVMGYVERGAKIEMTPRIPLDQVMRYS